MPTARGEKTSGGRRVGCRDHFLGVLWAAGRPLPRKQLVNALRDAMAGHRPGTVAKALADLTAAGELVDPNDKKGYRLVGWPKRPQTPSLFA